VGTHFKPASFLLTMCKRTEFTTKPAVVPESDLDTVPWDLLDTVPLRRKLLVKPEAFSHVETLDPMRMSPPDVYNVLTLLVKGQDSGVRLLEFSVENSDTDPELEISELIDTPTQSPEPPASLRDTGINNSSTALDNDASPLQSFPPLSESTIEVAIKNVAEAGHLRIVSGETTIHAPNQVLTFENRIPAT
jgi:hypothetical protein